MNSSKNNNINNKLDDPNKRAERLRILRGMTGMNRQQFAKTHKLHYETLKGWEIARHGGLSKKGALTVINIFTKCNIVTTYDWLMNGIGQLPYYFDLEQNEDIIDNFSKIKKLLSQVYPGSIGYKINDDSMSPQYNKGDYVHGTPIREIKNYDRAIGKACIVQLQTSLTYFRILHRVENGKCDLRCLNIDTVNNQPWIYAAAPISITPVIWHYSMPISDEVTKGKDKEN